MGSLRGYIGSDKQNGPVQTGTCRVIYWLELLHYNLGRQKKSQTLRWVLRCSTNKLCAAACVLLNSCTVSLLRLFRGISSPLISLHKHACSQQPVVPWYKTLHLFFLISESVLKLSQSVHPGYVLHFTMLCFYVLNYSLRCRGTFPHRQNLQNTALFVCVTPVCLNNILCTL